MGGATSNAYIVERATGRTAVETLSKIQQTISRRFFLKDRRVIIIGESYARHGIADLLDEMVRNSASRLRSYILVANHCPAWKLLNLDYPLDRLPSDAMLELEDSNRAVAINLIQFVSRLGGDSDPYASGIEEVDVGKKRHGATFRLNSVAVFHKDALVGWLNREESKGFLYIYPNRNRIRDIGATVNIKGQPGYISTSVLHSFTTMKVTMKGDRPALFIEVTTVNDVVDNGTKFNMDDPATALIVERELGKGVLRQVNAALYALQKKYQSDAIGIADIVHEEYPKQWKAIRVQWRKVFSEMPTTVRVHAQLVRSGLTSNSVSSLDHALQGKRTVSP